nr:reverse transcriptase domain-containing protein [Tanacetum cinerariifolium]
LRLRFEQEAKLLKKAVAQVARRDQRIEASEKHIKNLEALPKAKADMKAQISGEERIKAAFKEFKNEDDWVTSRCAKIDARLDALSIDFDKELYPHMITAIAGRRWVIRHGLRLVVMKCAESTKLRQDKVDLAAIEAYDPEADIKYVMAFHALKDLKYPLVNQLEKLKDAPIDVIMASLFLKSDSGEDALQWIRELRPSSSQLKILVYPEVRNPKDAWSFKEEILDCPRNKNRPRGIEESYSNTRSSYKTRDMHGYYACNMNRSRSIKRGRGANPRYLACQRATPAMGDTRNKGKKAQSSRRRRLVRTLDLRGCRSVHTFNPQLQKVWFDELPPESIDGYKGLKAAILAYFMQQKKYVKYPVEIHNIKQRDGETIEEFMKRFKIKTRRIKGAPECMRISRFMHGVNNPELTKRLNERIPKTVEEMMTATRAFIRGETTAASKKKVHTPWKSHDQSKRHTSERRSDFQNQPKDGRGSNKFTPLTRTPKEIFMAESGKFKPPPPMVNPIEKRATTNSAIKALGNYRGHRALYKSMNQFYDSEVTITAQRPGKREIQAVPSTAHGMLKFPMIGGILTIRSTILRPTECTIIATIPKEITKKAEARHGNFKVVIHPDFSDQEITIGGTAKKQGQVPERTKAIQLEVQKLVEAGILREVYYHDWLSNPVIVKKYDDSWRMCVDFTDLNKAYPQDCYPLLEIDWKVESLCGYPFKCFVNAYKGYHQIQMAKQDKGKTAFHTSHGYIATQNALRPQERWRHIPATGRQSL